jgi:hypothetical protein
MGHRPSSDEVHWLCETHRELCPKNKTKLVNTDSEFQRIIIIFAGQKTFRVCVPYSCSKIVSPENYIETDEMGCGSHSYVGPQRY